jgi:hypothetical protein
MCSGNPAYLESVSIATNKLFGGKASEFCKYEELFLTEDIKSMLAHQIDRQDIYIPDLNIKPHISHFNFHDTY